MEPTSITNRVVRSLRSGLRGGPPMHNLQKSVRLTTPFNTQSLSNYRNEFSGEVRAGVMSSTCVIGIARTKGRRSLYHLTDSMGYHEQIRFGTNTEIGANGDAKVTVVDHSFSPSHILPASTTLKWCLTQLPSYRGQHAHVRF